MQNINIGMKYANINVIEIFFYSHVNKIMIIKRIDSNDFLY